MNAAALPCPACGATVTWGSCAVCLGDYAVCDGCGLVVLDDCACEASAEDEMDGLADEEVPPCARR
jgi:regulator of RNase E activity RraA